MNSAAALLIAAVVVLPALGLAFWACCVMDQVDEEMDACMGWKRLPFEDPTASHDPHKGMT
ncbi:MAG: hypothetical protein QFE16_17345 [Pseudomonadota bacterium]|nr:hypothetical protein [Pseudomonadota bacterium]